MKFLLIAAILAVHLIPAAPAAAATIAVEDPSQFILEVKGIVCSFCAFGARKNLSRVEFLDRSKFKKGLLMETEKGTITGAIAKGKKIDFQKVFRAIQKGGYDIRAVHLNLSGVPEKRNGSVVLTNRYNGQEFLLSNEDGQPWDAQDQWGKEVSVQAYASEAVLAKAAPGGTLAVIIKGDGYNGLENSNK